MKIIVDKSAMVTALSNVTRAVSAKSPFTALEGVLLATGEGTITLTGYDLEMGIITSVEADIVTPGKIVLSARLFFDMIRGMPGDKVTVSCDDKLLTTITSGLTEYTILAIGAEDYPELPSLDAPSSVSMHQLTLKSMINQTLFSVASVDSKPAHKGSLFDILEGTLNMVSVDGFRLAMRTEAVSSPEDMKFIVPGKTLAEISKLIKDDCGECDVQIMVSRKHIVFKVEGYSIISRLIEGDFLDYKSAIPVQFDTEVVISVKEFIESIERTSLLVNEKIKSPLRITFTEGSVDLLCSTSIGKASDTCNCKLIGNPVEIGFHYKYLQDALKAAGCDEIKLLMGGALVPLRMVPVEGTSFLFMIMPVRLKNQ